MVQTTVTQDEYEELRQKHNFLCDMLQDMKLNPLADFEVFKVEETFEDEENEDSVEDNDNEEISL